MRTPLGQVRSLEVVRGAWGAALMLAPGPVLQVTHRVRVDRTGIVVARILGARQLAQALLSGWNPTPSVLALGVWVDAVHASTAVGLAAVDRRRAWAGLVDASVAGGWSLLGLHDLRRRRPDRTTDHDQRRDRLAQVVLRLLPGTSRLRRLADRP